MRLRAWQRRLAVQAAQALLAALAVSIVAFLVVRIAPGDPTAGVLGQQGTDTAVAALRAQLHLDQPLTEQFREYFTGLLGGDLGQSVLERGTSVSSIISRSLSTTLPIVLSAMGLAVLVGVPLGLWAALTRHRAVDVFLRSWAVMLLATPTFFVGLVLILVLSIQARMLPAGGWSGTWPENLRYIVLPAVALSSHLTAMIIRTVRQAAVDVAQDQFVEAAVARGLPRRVVNVRHILPNSVLPVVTLLGISLGALFTGAVIVEAVFGLPGVGTELVKAVAGRDYPVIQGIAVISALIVVFGNFLAEAAYVLVDPRARRA